MFDRALVTRLLCVGLVAALMFPAGQMIYPYIGGELSDLEFQAIEAVLSATLGFAIYAAIA